MKKIIMPHEKFNAYSHLTGAAGGFIATILLIMQAFPHGVALIIVVAVSGLSITLVFAASFLFHYNNDDSEDSIWLKLDHMAIFFMISGSFVAPLYIYAPLSMFIKIVIILALLSLLGVAIKVRNPASSRWFNFILYFPLGMIALVPMSLLWNKFDVLIKQGVNLPLMKSFLVAGLVIYASGGVIYSLNRPMNIKWKLGNHEIFHLTVIAGATCHCIALYLSIESFPLIKHISQNL